MSTRGYDRSGRLDMEQFHVSPPGRDPLHDHYQAGIYGGFIGGGLSGGDKELTADSEIIREDLNEWVALDNPGHYSLFVTSGRVSHRNGAKLDGLTLHSNTLEFDAVEASPAWQVQTAATAAATLANAASSPDEKSAAARTLRFLDTPDSVRELAHQLTQAGDASRWDLEAGLLGTRHRQEAVATLEAQLAAPDAGITAAFLSALAEIKFLAEHEPMPPYPEHDTEQQLAWIARRDARVKEFAKLTDELHAEAARSAAAKRPAARAATVYMLLTRPSRAASDWKPLNGLPEDQVVSAFALMTPRQQSDLLQTFWERLKTPGMATVLEAILDRPGQADDQLRGTVTQRLYELDPRAGRTYILAEIRHPQPNSGRAMSDALTLLPDETLPQFDEILAARLESDSDATMDLDARLIGRYATSAIAPRVKAAYQKSAGDWACTIEDDFVSYFLRVEPDYGLERVRAKAGRCMTESLKIVVAAGHWQDVEQSVIARLNTADTWAARDAAETLAKYGTSKAQKALWQRIRAFHEQWADRGAEFVIGPATPREVNDAISLQFGLVESLGRAQAWLLDNDQSTELESLAIAGARQNAAHWHWHSPIEINLILTPGVPVIASINDQFNPTDLASLQAKLAQYPSGTVFHLSGFGAPDRLAAVTHAIYETASQNALIIEAQPMR